MIEKDKQLLWKTIEQMNALVSHDIRIMEVCGTHTHQIARFGLRKLLSPKIQLVSGPGCPVCVTESAYIDALISLLKHKNVIVVTFGDLLRVRGQSGSLEEQKALGKQVVTVYSPEDVLTLAQSCKENSFVFAAVGFETTAPLYAALIQMAKNKGIQNLFLMTSLKRMEPAIRFILGDLKVNVDGMLCPGHVAAITGTGPFLPITAEYHIPAVICGFEEMDIISSIHILCRQIAGETPVHFMNAYRRCVSDTGNSSALSLINEVFRVTDANWRGIGRIKDSALTLNNNYQEFDAFKRFGLNIETFDSPFPDDCDCGKILIGEKMPDMCVNFGSRCTPEHPIGPCMISSEGACAAYYRYGGGNIE